MSLTRDTRITVAIATHNRGALLARTLESLAEAELPAEFDRVRVIENGSPGDARRVCEGIARRLPVEYFHLADSGKSRALDYGLKDVRDGFVVFLDDDVRVAPGLLSAYATAVRTHGEGHFYGGPLSVDYEAEPSPWLVEHLPHSARGWPPSPDKGLTDRPQPFMGANFGVFANDIHGVGGFRADLGPGAFTPGTEGNPTGQDWEFQRRLRRAGIRPVYVSDARVWHYVPRDRCTPEWALHRVYRHHFKRTLTVELERPATVPRVQGVPLRSWTRLLRARFGEWVAIKSSDPLQRFEASYQVHKVRGKIQGYRAARNRDDGAEGGSQ